MSMKQIPADTRVNSFGKTLHFEGGSRAVLIVHGFTGRTAEMQFLAQHLNDAGFTVRVPRLPGHGTNAEDFLSASWRDWLRRTYDEYLELAATYTEVSVVGLSMGGVLTVLAAERFGIPRIVLCAPALEVANRLIWLTPIVGLFRPRREKKDFEASSEYPEERELERQYYRFVWYRPASQLYRLIRMARRRLPGVRSATLTIVSGADQTVPASVADYIDRRIGAREKETLRLRDSGHVVVNGVDREQVARAITEWVSRGTS